jgi:hypothetical protein
MTYKKETSMSHVDEGMLHAYLDGELAAAERSALEAHVAQCEACRARVNEERALVERASTLLRAVRPLEHPVPPFEQIRRAPKRSPWRVRTSFAWAASIVLAVGLGYYIAGAGVYRRASQMAEPTNVAVQNRPADKAAAPSAPSAPSARDEARPSTRARQEVAERRRLTNEREESGDTQNRAPLAGIVATATPAPVIDSSAMAKVIVRGAAPAASMQRQDAADTWPRIDRQTAKTILGTDPVGLPDIATLQIRRSPDKKVVVVEQALDSRTVIQLFQQPNTNAAGYAFSEGARGGRLARFVGNLRVEIGGPVSVDSLNRLLELVRPLP